MDAKRPAAQGSENLNLDAVQALVDALEADLSRLREGSGDVQRLREEVEQLKSLLGAPKPAERPVRHALHGVRSTLDREWGTAKSEAFTASRYVAEIGRILGLS
jgi:hypothetical protein